MNNLIYFFAHPSQGKLSIFPFSTPKNVFVRVFNPENSNYT